MNTHPKWLITILNLMCIFQLLVGEQASYASVGGGGLGGGCWGPEAPRRGHGLAVGRVERRP